MDPLNQQFAADLDRDDPLQTFRDKFYFPRLDPDDQSTQALYLCGNSLGLQPKTVKPYLDEELEAWKNMGVHGHFKKVRPWLTIEDPVIEPLAKLVGSKPIEVAPMNTLTMNLHVMMIHFYRPTQQRHKILIEDDAFPSDVHAVEAQIRLHGFNPATSLIRVKPREGEYTIRTEDVASLIDGEGSSLALVLLGAVQFYTGQFFEVEKITQVVHKAGAIAGWDLAHAVGNVPLELHNWGVDFACWCSYKYLNAGPGTIAGVFVHEKYAFPSAEEGAWAPRLAGWFGHELETRFTTGMSFKPMAGALGFRASNPSVLCITALRASLDVSLK